MCGVIAELPDAAYTSIKPRDRDQPATSCQQLATTMLASSRERICAFFLEISLVLTCHRDCF
jgi:hypothetical protein